VSGNGAAARCWENLRQRVNRLANGLYLTLLFVEAGTPVALVLLNKERLKVERLGETGESTIDTKPQTG
jgi:hypothetical protein